MAPLRCSVTPPWTRRMQLRALRRRRPRLQRPPRLQLRRPRRPNEMSQQPFEVNPLPPTPPTPPAITALQRYAMLGVVAMFLGLVALVVAALFTHHELSDPVIVQLLGFGVTILVAL